MMGIGVDDVGLAHHHGHMALPDHEIAAGKDLGINVLAQGLLLTNNICFIGINGLVGLALAPRPWMATLPICAYVAGGALMARWVGRHQLRFGRRRAFQIGLLVALLSCALALGSVLQLLPSHVDPTFNLHDELVVLQDGVVHALWPIAARGLSR